MSPQPLRIAMIGQKGIPAVYGGVERHVEEISSRLSSRGHKVTVYCRPYYMQDNNYDPADTSRTGKTAIRILPTIKSKHLDAIVHTAVCSMHSLFQEYDIVHYHAIGPSTLSILPRMTLKKVVATVHGLDWQRQKWNRFASLYLQFGEWTSFHFPNKTITVSKSLKQYYENKYGGAVTYIPNGVNIPSLLPANTIKEKYGLEKDSYIVFISRLVPEKGCHYLVDSYSQITTDKKLVIVGGSSHSDDYVAQLKQQAKDNKSIIFTGNVYGNELAELFSNAYCFVLPSELEGLPIVILEALSFGKCILASDIPENKEVILPDNSLSYGFTFRNKDTSDLRRTLEFLVQHPEEVRKMSATTVPYVKATYNWDTITDQTEALYYSLCSPKGD
ncbi:MAG: glycosyltransferase [Candidatus Auribacter fodinae]|jgi:glycosyltransferase involved in cell wall biosynthesis|uniref:Glycosyltransferase n=1 Tax=Candidatus Auribacter fodinae TaxID=2093366 RepID=A0A3A4R548_9BACT|nr:MAG: glycosyltransferase [Candidatus Auribacter fodinae]